MVQPRPGLGYAMVAAAATLFAINGTVSKVILGSGISSGQLTAVRCAGAFIGLTLIAVATRPGSLRADAGDLPLLIALGIGLAVVQWSFFFAIHRLDIGIALLIQYVAPILVALWARFVFHEHVRRRIWTALALSLAGLTLIVEIWHGGRLSGPGVAAAVLAAISYATYVLTAERGVRRPGPISPSPGGFLFATIFSSVLAPWWSFPRAPPGSPLALRVGLSLRDAFLVGARTVVELPRAAPRRPRFAARDPRVDTCPALGADVVDGRSRRDPAVRADRERPPPHLRHPG